MQMLYDPFHRFYQKREPARTLNAAVVVLMDLSASMWEGAWKRQDVVVCACISSVSAWEFRFWFMDTIRTEKGELYGKNL